MLVAADPTGREHELPAPLGRRIWKLSVQRGRQHNAAKAGGQIASMSIPHDIKTVLAVDRAYSPAASRGDPLKLIYGVRSRASSAC